MIKKDVISPEEKVGLVRLCIAGEISTYEAGRKIGVSQESIRRWIERYKEEGAEGFLPREKNRVYSAETKLRAIKDYLSGNGSYQYISKKYKLRSSTQLKRWVKRYNTHGDVNSVKYSGGVSYMKQSRGTTQEERIQIAKECYASGKNYGEVALKYNVSYQQVRSWTLRYEELGEAGLEDRRGKRKKDQAPRTPLEDI